MGILNVTPDSFSDGGDFFSIGDAIDRALFMVQEGATIIDIGGESSRPGADPVPTDIEIKRIIPVIYTLKKENIPVKLSIDTCKPEVMRRAVDAGVDIINDIMAMRAEGALEIAASSGVTVSLMHMQGRPRTMQQNPHYDDVISDVKHFLEERVHACIEAGISYEKIILDPGFGFGKTLEHNVELFKNLDMFQSLGFPILVGVSRKSMIGTILNNAPVSMRLYGSLALAVLAAQKGAAIIRVHDVKATQEVLRVLQTVS
ncbi:MAG: dihydropteroate synthase [Gammaproteobacteria bacterium]|nr:MAG: dihydropteroate synthase [Gammaproteobacteria bacterium]